MRLDALREAVRTAGVDERAAALAGLSGEEAARLFGALVGVVLLDPSLRVRQEAEAALRRRPPEDQADRPAPHAATDAERAEVFAALLEDRGLCEVLLATPRGRELLAALPPERAPVDDRLLRLCVEAADPAVIRDVLALPLDVGGRSATLLAALPGLPAPARAAVVDALVWAALQGGTATVAEAELARARALVGLWVEGLVAARGDPALDPPTLAAFAAAGASLGRGPTTLTASGAPAPATLAALGELAQAAHLELAPRVHIDPAPLRAAAAAPSPELRACAWRALLRSGLATPAEALAAAAAEPAPGVAVELALALVAAGAPVPPGEAPRALALLGHRLASVRAAAVALLAKNPLLAALAAATFDPRGPGAPLDLLAALPAALRDAALAAWLEAERPPAAAARALGLLDRPPPPTWPRWPALLGHGAPTVRRAARDALLRLPPAEGPAAAALLEARRLEDPLGWARGVERFGLPGAHAGLAHLALDETADPQAVAAAVHALAGLARAGRDRVAWATLAAVVVGGAAPPRASAAAAADASPGGGRRRRCAGRAARAAALEALLALPDPPDPAPGPGDAAAAAGPAPSPDGSLGPLAAHLDPATRDLLARPAHLAWPGLVLALLDDRDPWQVRLGLRAAHRAGGRAVPARVAALLRSTLAEARRPRASRRRRAGLARCLRGLLPAGWVGPGPGTRGRPRDLLPWVLDAAARLGRADLWAADARPLLGHADAAVRAAAARLYPSLPGARPLGELLAGLGPDVALEAVRAAPLAQVEGVVLERLGRLLRRGPPPGDVAAWLEARPEVAAAPAVAAALARLLEQAPARAVATRGHAVLARTPAGRDAARAAVAGDAAAAVASRDDAALRASLDLARALARDLDARPLAAALLPALAWAGEAARDALVAFVREALEPPAGAGPAPLGREALAPLLAHPLGEVRALGLSLLRKGDPAGLFAAVRPAGPCPGRRLPVEQAKPFLGACEDAWEDACALAVEALLAHDDGEVARRALKLLNRREREASTLALLERVADPELRAAALTTFSTWAAPHLEPRLEGLAGAARAERLEALRRELRASLELLATGARAAVAPALDDALASPVPALRAAALRAIGRVGLAARSDALAAALPAGAAPDPVLGRCAAAAAGDLLAAPGLPATTRAALLLGLRRAAAAREAEVRATARVALVRGLPLEGDAAAATAAEVEGLLVDASPEVVLEGLAAALARPGLLVRLALEARLGDPDPRVREVALRALARRGPAAATPEGRAALAQALRGPLADPWPEVRLAALEVARAWDLAGALHHELAAGLADPSVHVAGATLDALEVAAAGAGAGTAAAADVGDPGAGELEDGVVGEDDEEGEAEGDGAVDGADATAPAADDATALAADDATAPAADDATAPAADDATAPAADDATAGGDLPPWGYGDPSELEGAAGVEGAGDVGHGYGEGPDDDADDDARDARDADDDARDGPGRARGGSA